MKFQKKERRYLFYVLILCVFLRILQSFLFLKEFNLSPYQMMISLVLFSLIPLYSYYQFDGRYPALMNVFFGLIYWKFLKRSVDNWNKKEFLITSLFFSLMILVHSLTAVIFGFVTFFWALSYSPNLRTAINFSKIILLSFLFSSF